MYRHARILAFCTLFGLIAPVTAGWAWAAPADEGLPNRVVQHGTQFELRSPLFVLRLDTTAGLRAQSWENRLNGRTVSLGNGPELEFDIGLPGQPLQTPALEAAFDGASDSGSGAVVVFRLRSRQPALSAAVMYQWYTMEPVLRKTVQITNKGGQEWDRLLNVRLGTYPTKEKTSDQGQGFPLYLGDDRFMSLAHPAGWATGKDGQASLRQYPGVKLAPGKTFNCMKTVYGVAKSGAAHEAFAALLHNRMRRVRRHHDKPYAILESFGGKPDGSFEESEQYVLDHLAKVAAAERESSCRFDFYSMEFWVDYNGDLKRFDPQRFPNGFRNIRAKIAELGMAHRPVDRQLLGGLVRGRQPGRAEHDQLGTGQRHERGAAQPPVPLPRHRADQVDVHRRLPLSYPRERRPAAEVRQFRHALHEPQPRALARHLLDRADHECRDRLPARAGQRVPRRSAHALLGLRFALVAAARRYALGDGHRLGGGQPRRVAGPLRPDRRHPPGRSGRVARGLHP